MRFWPRSLFGRNVLLLAGTIVLSVSLSFISIYALILNSQISRVASIGAELVNTISAASFQLDPAARDALLAELDENPYLHILPVGVVPEIGNYRENTVDKLVMQRFIDQLDFQNEMDWRMGANRTLWLNLRIGEEFYWVAAESQTSWTPLRWFVFIMFVIVGVVTMIGIFATRHISKPLAALRQETDRLSLESEWQMANISGPTEITSLANSFELMSARLQEAEAIRADTLAELSHDLRTPLARLRLAVEMMDGEAELKDSANRQVLEIDRLIGQFMDYARGAHTEPATEFDLVELVREIATSWEVVVDAPPELWITGQKEFVRRGLINLVENAFKYGEPPVVGLGLSETATHAVVAVEDRGAGFDPANAPKMLSSFTRGDHKDQISGSGLGLAIVKRVAESHGGEVFFEQLEPKMFRATLTLALNAKH